ncbi:hypothetical protein OHB49_43645 (plasmid) [Streptomyces sp. NBC_01717]|uniref:hypothetical protein n=1 Tax=Streptomyces sp. NBC_01717 TaxID=2975918 RepID=UPI002E307FA4|nr:hypothetical protein [Streptomyces sp. NBC_01717]
MLSTDGLTTPGTDCQPGRPPLVPITPAPVTAAGRAGAPTVPESPLIVAVRVPEIVAAEEAGVTDDVGIPVGVEAVLVVAVPDVLSCQTPVPVADPVAVGAGTKGAPCTGAVGTVGDGAEAMTSLSPAGI